MTYEEILKESGILVVRYFNQAKVWCVWVKIGHDSRTDPAWMSTDPDRGEAIKKSCSKLKIWLWKIIEDGEVR